MRLLIPENLKKALGNTKKEQDGLSKKQIGAAPALFGPYYLPEQIHLAYREGLRRMAQHLSIYDNGYLMVGGHKLEDVEKAIENGDWD